MTQYYDLPHCCIPVNPRVLSHALPKAIVTTYYPERMSGVNTLLPEGERFPDMIWRSLAPMTEEPTKPVLMLMRHPEDRFLSNLALTALTPKEAIDDIDKLGDHFAPQARLAKNATVFRYPDQLQAFCEAAKLPYPLPVINRTTKAKAPLTGRQRRALEKYYAEDLKLWNERTP